MNNITLKYQLGSIGIYIDTTKASSNWHCFIETLLQQSFEGMSQKTLHPIKNKLIFYDYHTKPQTLGFYAPASGIYNQTSYDNPRTQTASFLDPEHNLHIWTQNPDFSVPFALQQILLTQDATLVHAAALTIREKNILLPAFGGIGKTTLLASLQDHPEVKILGDDLLVLQSNGVITPYHRPLCLYPYHFALFKKYFTPNRFPKLITKWRLSYLIIRRLLLSIGINISAYFSIAPLLRVPLSNIFATTMLEKNPQTVDGILILQRTTTTTTPHVKPIAPNDAALFMSNVIMHELAQDLPALILNLNGNKKSLSSYMKKIESLFQQATHSIINPPQQLLIPANLSPQQFATSIVPLLYDFADNIGTTSKPPLHKNTHDYSANTV